MLAPARWTQAARVQSAGPRACNASGAEGLPSSPGNCVPSARTGHDCPGVPWGALWYHMSLARGWLQACATSSHLHEVLGGLGCSSGGPALQLPWSRSGLWGLRRNQDQHSFVEGAVLTPAAHPTVTLPPGPPVSRAQVTGARARKEAEAALRTVELGHDCYWDRKRLPGRTEMGTAARSKESAGKRQVQQGRLHQEQGSAHWEAPPLSSPRCQQSSNQVQEPPGPQRTWLTGGVLMRPPAVVTVEL